MHLQQLEFTAICDALLIARQLIEAPVNSDPGSTVVYTTDMYNEQMNITGVMFVDIGTY